MNGAFWKYIPTATRMALSSRIENTLSSGLNRAKSSSLKSTYFSALRSVVTTPSGVAFLERVWRRQEKIPGLTFAEDDESTMALELAVRSAPGAASILTEQQQRLTNPDRKARFEFVMPALSDNVATRDAWFNRLSDITNRRREPWVIEGLRYLNHPLRAGASEKHLRQALDMLLEIQRTGDIFFPKNWMDATFSGHRTPAAAEVVHAFLSSKNNYPLRLRRIILQSTDDLFRANEILKRP
jgi:aminopeptidase N